MTGLSFGAASAKCNDDIRVEGREHEGAGGRGQGRETAGRETHMGAAVFSRRGGKGRALRLAGALLRRSRPVWVRSKYDVKKRGGGTMRSEISAPGAGCWLDLNTFQLLVDMC